LDIPFSCWFSGVRVLSIFSGVSSVSTKDAEGPGNCCSGFFIPKDVDGVGDNGSGDVKTVDVLTLLEAFLEDSRLGTISLNHRSIRISDVSVSGLKEFYCNHFSQLPCSCTQMDHLGLVSLVTYSERFGEE
jgi:hypothetical protein